MVTVKNGNALSAIVVRYVGSTIYGTSSFCSCLPTTSRYSLCWWCRHSTVFYYTFAFFSQQLSTTTQKSISFMRITLRSCCSLVLISIVVVVAVKMLSHRQTHCTTEWCFFWWSLQCALGSSDEMITIEWDGKWENSHCSSPVEWHSGKFETENYYYRCNCRAQKCFARLFVWPFCVSMQQTGWWCLNVLLCHLNVPHFVVVGGGHPPPSPIHKNVKHS